MKNIITLLFTMVAAHSFAQTTMNIYQSNANGLLQISLSDIDSITYTPDSLGNLANIDLTQPKNQSANSFWVGGVLNWDGGTAITELGFCISTLPNPTTADITVTVPINSDPIPDTRVDGLAPSTTYYVRAYAINAAGTSYSFIDRDITTTAAVSYTLGSGVTDIDGNTYGSVILGNGQEWMSSNLNVATYRNGDPIPELSDSTAWANHSAGGWTYFNEDPQFEAVHGKMYSDYTVIDTREVCPTGWRLPSELDFNELEAYTGGQQVGSIKIFSVGVDTIMTNETGLSATTDGYRNDIGGFSDGAPSDASSTVWMGRSSTDPTMISQFTLWDLGGIHHIQNNGAVKWGFTIRCIK